MAQRHNDALYIQDGASNGIGVANALVRAYREALNETHHTDEANKDPAVQLMLHQLCHLAKMVVDTSGSEERFDYDRAYQVCIDNASEPVLEALRLTDRKTKPPEPASAAPVATESA